jgi:hypothetical protein
VNRPFRGQSGFDRCCSPRKVAGQVIGVMTFSLGSMNQRRRCDRVDHAGQSGRDCGEITLTVAQRSAAYGRILHSTHVRYLVDMAGVVRLLNPAQNGCGVTSSTRRSIKPPWNPSPPWRAIF